MGRSVAYTYASNNIDVLQATEVLGTDNSSLGSWTYNTQHLPLTYTDGSGQLTQYTYNSSGQLLTLTDANSNVTKLTYTGSATATIGGTKTTGDVLTITVHDAGLTGGQEAVSYTVLSTDTLTTIASGLTAAINADTHLSAIGVRATSAAAVITLLSTSVNITSYTESVSAGATETITLTAATSGYLTQVDGPLAGADDITTFTYDSVGRLATITDSEGYVRSFLYDNADRLTKTTYPDGTTEKIAYDRLDAVLQTDRIGRTTQSSFDSIDQLSYVTDPLGRKTQYTWCVCASLASITDPAGNQTSWSHDIQGRVLKKTYFDGSSVNYVWDNFCSRLVSRSDALNQRTNYNLSSDDRPVQVGYLNAVNATAPVNYVWDPAFPRISSVNKTDWGMLSYTYNPYIAPGGTATTGGGMLQKVHNNVIANSDITYLYDVLGRTTNRSINSTSNSITWAYDAMSRITSEANALGTFNYSYVDDVPGSSKGTLRLASIAYPNSQVTNFSWYPNIGDQRLQQIQNLNPSTALLSQFNYNYDSSGQITQWQQQQNGNNLFYNLGYDQAGQLTSASAGSGGPASPPANEFFYSYDNASNRTAVQQSGMQTVRIGGTKSTGDTLTVTVTDAALSGGTTTAPYTVLSGDTISSIAAGLATAINTNTNLQALGVSANAHGSNEFINIRSVSPNLTTYAFSTSGGATETLTAGIFRNGVESLTVGGTKTTGNVLTLKVVDPALTGGSHSVTYTVLSTDTTTTMATGLKSAINADSSLSTLGVTATSATNVVSIKSNSKNATNYTSSVTTGGTETLTLAPNQNGAMLVNLQGAVTTGDVLTLTTYDSGLSGGKQAITYTALSTDTLTSEATGLTTAINANSSLSGKGITATSSGPVITLSSNSPNSTLYRPSYSASSTEAMTISQPTYGWQVAALGGTKTTGDVLKLIVTDAGLSTGTETVSYTVLSTDTLTSIATALAAAVNADSNLSALGISATANSTVVSLESLSPNTTSYAQSVSSGGTETIALNKNIGVTQSQYNNLNELTSQSAGGSTQFQAASSKPVKSASTATQVVSVKAAAPSAITVVPAATGTATESTSLSNYTGNNGFINFGVNLTGTATPGDVVEITFNDVLLAFGTETVSYTVESGDTLTSIAVDLSNLINADSNLANANIVGGSGYAVVYITDLNNATYPVSSTAIFPSAVGLASETLTQSLNADSNATITVGGTVTTNDVVSATIENANLANGQETVSYTVPSGASTTTVATGLTAAINADAHLAAIGVAAASSGAVITISNDTSYTTATSIGATETASVGTNYRGNVQVTVGGTPTTGDTVTISAHNPSLSGGVENVTYTVLSTDTLQTVSAGLAAAINADANLKALGISTNNSMQLATTELFNGNGVLPSGVSSASISAIDGSSNVKTNGLQVSTSGASATSLTYDLNGNMTSVESSYCSPFWDVLGMVEKNADSERSFVSSGEKVIGRKGDFTHRESRSKETVPALQDLHYMRISPLSMEKSALLPESGGSCTDTCSWDAENRLIKITYPGSGNYSTFVYDGLGRNATIVETTGGSVTSTKIVCWVSSKRCEERDATGTITKQFFSLGEKIGANSYCYTTDHLGLTVASVRSFPGVGPISGHPRVFNPLAFSGSVREMTNSSGVIQDQRAYDPFGRTTQLQGSLASDVQYGGYYVHSRSMLNLTRTRAYSSAFARFISRDPIEEDGGVNLFSYGQNNPTSWTDPSGTSCNSEGRSHKFCQGYCNWWCAAVDDDLKALIFAA